VSLVILINSNITNKSEKKLEKCYKITTESNKSTIVTWNHKCFVSQPDYSEGYYLYIMYRRDKKFRIGVTAGGKTKKTQARTANARPDRFWFIGFYKSKIEAHYHELRLSIKYQIPTYPYFLNGCGLSLSQDKIDLIFDEFGQNGYQLCKDKRLVFEFPSYIPQSKTNATYSRKNINLILNHIRGGFYITYEENKIREAHISYDYKQARIIAEDMKIKYNADIVYEKYSVKNRKYFNVAAACQIFPGMDTPVVKLNKETNVYYESYEKIISVEDVGEREVYDIEVGNTGILIADDIITHNSVYSFRQSNPEHFNNFKHDYNNVKIIKLARNYRSTPTQNIVKASNTLIDNNDNQDKEECFSKIDSTVLPIINKYADENNEGNSIAKLCKQYVTDKKLKYSDIAVIYRVKYMSRSVEQALVNESIPYQIVGNVQFFERREIKDLMSYLIFINNFNDELSFRRLCVSPRKGIGEKTIDKLLNCPGEDIVDKCLHATNMGLFSKRVNNSLRDILDLISNNKRLKPNLILKNIVNIFDFDSYIKVLSADKEEYEDRVNNINELINQSSKSKNLSEFINEVSLMNNQSDEEVPDRIDLMTMHASKGLEYKLVFIVGLEYGILPHYLASKKDQKENTKSAVEEERRLFYVGITRAEKYLYISYCSQRTGKIKYKSPFIKEIETMCLDIDKNKRTKRISELLNIKLKGKNEGKNIPKKTNGKDRIRELLNLKK